MYLHALTSEMVPDANSLLIEELPEVATSQNNKGGKFLKKLWCCVGGSITR